ncbi:hypothetical protein HYC85_004666 [Camellia sinensis]|uniref:Uncharacterized protein n=1 Tax=Camellia sinensis TaxID=4442 RepID=A0A7J7HYV6_CAMSI|nr:hypothetical protein HYC85_004666 [Camellia sinensis]
MSAGDDVGMKLLASVAAGEMSMADLISPTDSPRRNTPTVEDSCMGDGDISKSSHEITLLESEVSLLMVLLLIRSM